LSREELALFGGPKTIESWEGELTRGVGELGQRPLPVGASQEEIEAIVEALKSGDFARYKPIYEFEKEFASYMNVKYALATNNGTSSILAALFAIGVGPGDEVITPSYTWHLGVTPILALRAIPIFCEIDPKTLTADPEDIKRRITPRTKAIIVTHIWGVPADMDPIMEIAQEHGIPVIEDASHAHGNEYKGRKVGTIGDIGCFSLQMSKALPAGEGGVLITNNEDYFERAVVISDYSRVIRDVKSEELKKYRWGGFGFKFRMHPLAAVLAKVWLRRLDHQNEIRRRNHEYLYKRLLEVPGIEPQYIPPYAKMGAWYGFRAQYFAEQLNGVPKERFIEALRAEGVPVFPERYWLVHLIPALREQKVFPKDCPFKCPYVECKVRYKEGDLPITEAVYKRLIGFPTFQGKDYRYLIDKVMDAVWKVIRNIDVLE